MFSEYFLTDDISIKLLKKTLILLDTPDYDLRDFKELVGRLLLNNVDVRSRAFKKTAASLNLVASILLHYCQENGNLKPAMIGLNSVVLQTWAWILKQGLEKKKAVLQAFRQLLRIQFELYAEYFKKTLKWACEEDGLFVESGGQFESVGYPMRSFEYLGDLAYFSELREYYPKFDGYVPLTKRNRLQAIQKDILLNVASENDGCARPLLDNHYIPIVLFVLYFLKCEAITAEERILIHNYIGRNFQNLAIIRIKHGRWPELGGWISKVIEYNATSVRPFDYSDSSSLLITYLFELLILFGGDTFYESCRENFIGEHSVNLQAAYPLVQELGDSLEEKFFSPYFSDSMYVEHSIALPENAEDFRKAVKAKQLLDIPFRTEAAGFPFLRTLSNLVYKNDVFPYQWRKFFSSHGLVGLIETAEDL